MSETSELKALRKELQGFRDIEAIKTLKASYNRHMTLNQSDELEALLTEDAESSYSDGQYTFSGRQALMEFLRTANSTAGKKISWWLVGMPEITLHDAEHASAIWGMLQFLIVTATQQPLVRFSYTME